MSFLTQLNTLTPMQRIQRSHVELMGHQDTMEYASVIMVGKYEVRDDVPTACTNGIDCKYGSKFIKDMIQNIQTNPQTGHATDKPGGYSNHHGHFVAEQFHGGANSQKHQQSSRHFSLRKGQNAAGLDKMNYAMPLFQLENGLMNSCENRNKAD